MSWFEANCTYTDLLQKASIEGYTLSRRHIRGLWASNFQFIFFRESAERNKTIWRCCETQYSTQAQFYFQSWISNLSCDPWFKYTTAFSIILLIVKIVLIIYFKTLLNQNPNKSLYFEHLIIQQQKMRTKKILEFLKMMEIFVICSCVSIISQLASCFPNNLSSLYAFIFKRENCPIEM